MFKKISYFQVFIIFSYKAYALLTLAEVDKSKFFLKCRNLSNIERLNGQVY